MLLRKADGRGGFHPLYNPQTVPAFMEHETGIEPALSAWKAEVLAIKRLAQEYLPHLRAFPPVPLRGTSLSLPPVCFFT